MESIKYLLILFPIVYGGSYYDTDEIIDEILPSLQTENSDVATLLKEDETFEGRKIAKFTINFDERCENVRDKK